nr:unnamed protein product [Digitaria exilis]
MTPDRLVSPTVGLIPTTELDDEGQSIEPSVSDPSVTAAMFAAAATPGPALDPHGVTERTYGFFTSSQNSLAATGAPAGLNGAEVGPLGRVGLAEDDCAGAAEAGHHAGVAGDDGAEQREGSRRGVEPVARGDVVLEEHGDAVQGAAAGGRGGGRALGVGALGLRERVRVDLDDGVEERV